MHVNPGTVVAVYYPEEQERPNPPPAPVNAFVFAQPGPAERACKSSTRCSAFWLSANVKGNRSLSLTTFQNPRS